MESMRDSIWKARYQQQSGQRPSQGGRPLHTQPPVSRRKLPEQTGRLGPAQQYPSSHRVRNLQGQGGQIRESRSYVEPGYAPVQQRPSSYEGTAFQTRSRTQPDRARPRTYPSRPSGDYHTDEYARTLPADVADDLDEEEDNAGIRYGDWEGGEEEEEEILIYQREDVEIVPNSRQHYAPSNPHSQHSVSAHPDYTMRPQQPRLPRDHRMSTVPSTLSQVTEPAAQALYQLQPAQETRPYRRVTQPLHPQAIAEMSREAARDPQYAQRAMRQIVPQGQLQPQISVSPTPPAPVLSSRGICPKCRGAGYLRVDVPYGHPNFGKPTICECKELEQKEKRRQQLWEMSNMHAFQRSNFSTFNPRVPGVQEAYQITCEYAKDPVGWLLLVGPNGCGKTHLAAAIANQSLDEGAVVLFAVVPDLLDHLRAAFAPNAAEVYDQLFSKMREAEVLILDDLGAQQSSPWANEKLFQLLNYRYNLCMPTVITANPRGLQGTDERIRSRLMDHSLVVTVSFDRARDYRPAQPRRP